MGDTETMKSSNRTLLLLLSACGTAASILIYTGSFFWQEGFHQMLVCIPFLMVGAFALLFYLRFIEGRPSQPTVFFFDGISKGLPKWAEPFGILLTLVVVAHFVWFGLHSGFGVPAIEDGQYVVESRSHILRTLSKTEYLALAGAELRMMASMVIAFYSVPTIYWWFRVQKIANNPR
jgi:hypothetical protein